MQYKAIEEIWRRADGSRFRIVRIVNAETYKIIGEQKTELTPAKRMEATA